MELWMNQGTTMRYNNTEMDFLLCNKYGFSAIELKYNMISNYSDEYIKQIAHKNNVRIGSLTGAMLPTLQTENVKEQCKLRFTNMCKLAKKIGAQFIVVYPARGKRDENRESIENDIVEELREYSDIANENNVRIALEVTGYHDSFLNIFDDGLKIIDMLQQECIGFVYDFYHMFGTRDLGQAIRLVPINKIFIVHIGDGYKCKIGDYLDANRLWPGDGNAGFDEQIKILRDIQYAGPCSLEVYKSTPWEFNMDMCYRIAREKMDWIKDCLQ